jgi:hypothetical protein
MRESKENRAVRNSKSISILFHPSNTHGKFLDSPVYVELKVRSQGTVRKTREFKYDVRFWGRNSF